MTVLPAMPSEQTASWHGVLDLYEHLDSGWTLIGGQLVHLHRAERGQFPVRPTNDVDAVIDVRADPRFLHTFTKTLNDLGFTPAGISGEGRQHRWRRGPASIDVLLPEGVGERTSLRQGVTGSPTLTTEGGTQALRRSETVPVVVDGRASSLPRSPTDAGAQATTSSPGQRCEVARSGVDQFAERLLAHRPAAPGVDADVDHPAALAPDLVDVTAQQPRTVVDRSPRRELVRERPAGAAHLDAMFHSA